MLIKNITEFRNAGVKIDGNYDFNQIKPAIIKVENSVIKPLITKALYDTLDQKYNSESPSWQTGEEKLVEYLQYWIAPLAFLMKAKQMGVKVDGSGTYKNKAQDKWFLSEIEQENWMEALQAEASSSRELVIEYLEETASESVLVGYYSGTAAAGFRELRIKTLEHFSRYYDLYPGWATFRSLRPFMKSVQFDRISPVLNTYYATFLALNPANDDEKKLVYCAERAIAMLSIARAMRTRVVTLSHQGVTVIDETDRYGKKVTASAQQVLDTYNQLSSEGEKALSDLETIIKEMAPDGYTVPEDLEDLNDADSNIWMA